MILYSLLCWACLAALHCVVQALPRNASAPSGLSTTDDDLNPDNSGPEKYTSRTYWEIEDCGLNKKPLLQVIRTAVNLLPFILNDLDKGAGSNVRFTAMFKSESYRWQVREMLELIVKQKKIPGLEPNPKSDSAPSFACASPHTLAQYPWLLTDLWPQCQTATALTLLYGRFIFICPQFFSLPEAPKFQGEYCMGVQGNMFYGPKEGALGYQTYIIIHEILHFYLGVGSLGPSSRPREKYLPNELVALNAYNSYRNPTNYQLYISSRFAFISKSCSIDAYAVVQQSCTAAPNPFQPPFNLGLKNGDSTYLNDTASSPIDNQTPFDASSDMGLATNGSNIGNKPGVKSPTVTSVGITTMDTKVMATRPAERLTDLPGVS